MNIENLTNKIKTEDITKELTELKKERAKIKEVLKADKLTWELEQKHQRLLETVNKRIRFLKTTN